MMFRTFCAAAWMLAFVGTVSAQTAPAPEAPAVQSAQPAAPLPVSAPVAPSVAATPAPAIKPGDVVQVKSGGPRMTVTSIEAMASVIWFVQSENAFRTAAIPVVALMAAEAEDDEDDEDEDDDDEDDEEDEDEDE